MARLIIFAAFVACSLLLSTYALPINLEEMFHLNMTRTLTPSSNSQILHPNINKRSTKRDIMIYTVGVTNEVDTDEVKFAKRAIDNQKKTLINHTTLDRRSTV